MIVHQGPDFHLRHRSHIPPAVYRLSKELRLSMNATETFAQSGMRVSQFLSQWHQPMMCKMEIPSQSLSSPAASSSSTQDRPCQGDGQNDDKPASHQDDDQNMQDPSDPNEPPSNSDSDATEAARQGVHIFRLGYPQTWTPTLGLY